MDFNKIREEIPTLIKLAKYGNRSLDNDLAEAFVISEIDELEYMIEGAGYMEKATEASAIKVLRTALKMGLSIDKNAGLVYIAAGSNSQKNCIELTYQVTTEGELFLAMKQGLILATNRPYKDGDKYVFEFTKGDGNSEKVEKDWEFFKRLKEYSSKKNNGRPNKLYGNDIESIDEGFACTKLVKHAIKKLGSNPMRGDAQKVLDVANYKPMGLVDEEELDGFYDQIVEEEEEPQPIESSEENWEL
jgi:hypothetical protein